jgi:glycosyltransferase involved in cell wall biosynthesis
LIVKPMRIVEITSYPPPRAGWGMRVQLLKRHLEVRGHDCVVLNIGQSRKIPSAEYETVLGPFDYLQKLWRFSARGYMVHIHVNGASAQGFLLALTAEFVNLLWRKRCVLTFHAGIDQIYFPRPKYPWLLPMFWVLFTIPRRIICNSDAVSRKIQEYGVSAAKISAIQAFSSQYLEFQPSRLDERIESFYRTFPNIVFSYINLRPKFHPVELLDGFVRVARRRPDSGLVLCGVGGYAESDIRNAVADRLQQPDLAGRVCVVDDLDHDRFLTALSRSAIFLRSHVSDGVCSSVLEALSFKVPVVAAENGQRPAGVLTYVATDSAHLASVLEDALARRDAIAATLPVPDIPDTLSVEADVLTGQPDRQKLDRNICAA